MTFIWTNKLQNTFYKDQVLNYDLKRQDTFLRYNFYPLEDDVLVNLKFSTEIQNFKC